MASIASVYVDILSHRGKIASGIEKATSRDAFAPSVIYPS